MRRSIHILAVLFLGVSLGLHWAALQAVAWTSMLVERAQTASFTEAVRTTFDGKHPCRICKLVQEGKSAQRTAEMPGSSHPFDISLGDAAQIEVPHIQQPAAVGPPAAVVGLRFVRPVVPPPRHT